MKRVLLADCNNFFVSCERIFNPKLRNKPVVVLSSNDACIIARSNEAKALGIRMGEPAFKCESILKKNNVIVCSANFTLYADISARVMQTIAFFASDLEIYSIDEAFFFIPDCQSKNKLAQDFYYTAYASFIRKKIKQLTGIPISIGIGPTKTLAKAANKIAKKELEGVYDISNSVDDILSRLEVGDIWGIGYRYEKFLKSKGINNALELKNCDEKWVRKNLTVMGLRTLLELKGICCISLDHNPQPRQSCIVSRSFGKNVTALYEIKEALASYISIAAEKIRSQKSLPRKITVFLMSNRYHETNYYFNNISFNIPLATCYTPDLIKIGHSLLEQIYKEGYQYKKVGVLFTDFVPNDFKQLDLYQHEFNYIKKNNLIKCVDHINNRFGRKKVFFAAEGIKQPWQTKKLKVSPCYTTNWHEILTITLK